MKLNGTATVLPVTNAGSAQTQALNDHCYWITADCNVFVLEGANPTASNTCFMLAANQMPVKITIEPGAKLAGRATTAGTGNIYLTPVPLSSW